MRLTIMSICLAMLALAPFAHLKKSATTGRLLKTSTGHLAKSCGAGGPTDCYDYDGCNAYCPASIDIVFNSDITYECMVETPFPHPETFTLPAGTYSISGTNCAWSGTLVNDCLALVVYCVGAGQWGWILTSDGGLVGSGTFSGPCPPASFNFN